MRDIAYTFFHWKINKIKQSSKTKMWSNEIKKIASFDFCANVSLRSNILLIVQESRARVCNTRSDNIIRWTCDSDGRYDRLCGMLAIVDLSHGPREVHSPLARGGPDRVFHLYSPTWQPKFTRTRFLLSLANIRNLISRDDSARINSSPVITLEHDGRFRYL